MDTTPRGYCLLEPEALMALPNLDFDQLERCLEVVRQQLPGLIPTGASLVEYDLLKVVGPHGPPYPAIGQYFPPQPNPDEVDGPDWLAMQDSVDQWVQQVGVAYILAESQRYAHLSWATLLVQGQYPAR